MKINGVDPRVIEQIKEQYTQPVVRETRESRSVRQYEEQEGRQERGQQHEGDRLRQSIDRLNRVYESFRNPVRFRLVEEGEETKVEVVDLVENQAVKKVEPEKIMSVMTQVEKLLGLLVDVLI